MKEENSSISKQVQVLREDASKQNQQLIQFLREKEELESKLEEYFRETDVVPVAQKESFRALKLSRKESFRALKFEFQIGEFYCPKTLQFGEF